MWVPTAGAAPEMTWMFTTPVPASDAALELVMADWLRVPPRAVPMLVVVPLLLQIARAQDVAC